MSITMDKLDINKKGIVTKINSIGIMRRRLMDIGIVKGTTIECVLQSPSKNPKAYLIKGSIIALRNDDAKQIEVKPI